MHFISGWKIYQVLFWNHQKIFWNQKSEIICQNQRSSNLEPQFDFRTRLDLQISKTYIRHHLIDYKVLKIKSLKMTRSDREID